ncbi:MAG: signal peptide peptidase SppA [Bradymonadaceae bacterium]
MKKRSIVTLVVIFGGLFLALTIFIAILIQAFSPDGFGAPNDRLGIVEVDGAIMESKKIVEDLRRFEKDDTIKGVVVRVNSPGGAVGPSQEIYEGVKRLRAQKPVVISMGTVAASGGYYVACGTDMIFANPATITGSIGVISQFFDVHKVLDLASIDVNTVKTGPYKDSGSPFREFGVDDELHMAALIGDIYDQFVEVLADCRGMDLEEAKGLADGRVFSGRQAKELNLIDEIGTLQDAVDHLKAELNLDEPPVVYPPKERMGFLSEMLRTSMQTTVSEARNQTTPRLQYRYVGPQ